MSRLLTRLFDFLSVAEPPVPSDAIVVFAGRPERKRYGLELFKRGLAPALALRHALGEFPVRVAYTAVPESDSKIRRDDWWRTVTGWTSVTGELLKLAIYRLLLSQGWRPFRGAPAGPRS